MKELTVKRYFSAEDFNAVVNDERVRPWLGGTGPLDFTGILRDPRNVLLGTPSGGVLFHWQEPTIYEAHTMFLPEVRGAQALRATLDALEFMFTRTDCMEVLSKAAHDNPRADRWATLSGGSLRFMRENCWPGLHGPVGMNFFAVTFEEWKLQTQDRLIEEGVWFHKTFEASLPESVHSVDSSHDCAVGVASMMIKAGQVQKAVILYNRWARFAGYQVITVLEWEPLRLDIGNAILTVVGERFEVLPCQ